MSGLPEPWSGELELVWAAVGDYLWKGEPCASSTPRPASST